MTRLHVISEALRGNTFDLSADHITIGRAADNTICLDHASVSKHHAILSVDGNDYKLRDLHSTNGTIVNSDSIVCTDLRDGDRIALGKVELRLELAEKSRVPSPSLIPLATTASPAPSKPKSKGDSRGTNNDSAVPVLIATQGPFAGGGKKEPALILKPRAPDGPIEIKKPIPPPQKEPLPVASQPASPPEPVLSTEQPHSTAPRKVAGASLHVVMTSVGSLLLIIGYAGESNALKSIGLVALTIGLLSLFVFVRTGSIIAPPKRRP